MIWLICGWNVRLLGFLCRKSRYLTAATTATRTSRVPSTRKTSGGFSTTAATSSSACICASTSFYDSVRQPTVCIDPALDAACSHSADPDMTVQELRHRDKCTPTAYVYSVYITTGCVSYPRAVRWILVSCSVAVLDCRHSVVTCTLFSGATFSKLLRKILAKFLILGQSLTISGKALTRHNFALLPNQTTSRNNFQQHVKIKWVSYNYYWIIIS